MLRIYEITNKVQEPFENTRELMVLNLTEEGVCSDPSTILRLQTAKTPANSYKRNNEDLRPDDKPYLTIFLKDGRFYHFILAVIDRTQSLISYKNRFPNQTRYIDPSRTANHPLRKDGSNKGMDLGMLRKEYRKPEIRIAEVIKEDLIGLMEKNLTARSQEQEDGEAGASGAKVLDALPAAFWYGEHVSLRGKRFLMAVDKHGYAHYFFTRDHKKFLFYGRYWVGGVLQLHKMNDG